MNYSDITSKDLQGVDASKEITLKEYGFAWHELPRKGIFRIYIGDSASVTSVENDFTRWDALEIAIDAVLSSEYPFVSVEDILAFNGLSRGDWDALPLPYKLYDCVNYYGAENF